MRTLDPFVAAYMRSRVQLGQYGPKSQRVVTPRLHTLSRSFGARPIDQLTHKAIETWLGSLSHLATNSKASYLVSVRQFTAWLTRESPLLHYDPCVTIAPIKRVKPLPRSQTHDAVAAALEACRTDRERAIIWLMVGIGLRRMEVAGLRWEHYDDRAELIEVRHAKNQKERVLPVPAEVAAALRQLRGGGMTGPIIRSCNDDHAGISVERVGQIASRILSRAGVKLRPYDGVSGHALRHTAASDVLDECGDLRVVQAMLGHENLATTAIYLRRASAVQMREAMEGRSYTARRAKAA